MDQVKPVDDSLVKIWSNMVFFLKKTRSWWRLKRLHVKPASRLRSEPLPWSHRFTGQLRDLQV